MPDSRDSFLKLYIVETDALHKQYYTGNAGETWVDYSVRSAFTYKNPGPAETFVNHSSKFKRLHGLTWRVREICVADANNHQLLKYLWWHHGTQPEPHVERVTLLWRVDKLVREARKPEAEMLHLLSMPLF